jgi:hypothetical protein
LPAALNGTWSRKDRSRSGAIVKPSNGSHSRPSAICMVSRKAFICAVVISPA